MVICQARRFTASQLSGLQASQLFSINQKLFTFNMYCKYILLTIDVEDWFQVENFKPWIPFETWDQRELRVEKNVRRLLDLFDSVEIAGQQEGWKVRKLGSQEPGKPKSFAHPCKLKTTRNSQLTTNDPQHTSNNLIRKNKLKKKYPQNPVYPVKYSVKATFFILGWIAERLPGLVREIKSRGHEIASHGYHHQLPVQLSAKDLKSDLEDSKKQLEDIVGSRVSGYRAPNFAISDDILKTIEDCGYLYDSSYNSFGLHGRYGRISLNGSGRFGIAHKVSDHFFELPISNLRLAGKTLPWGGGGYFRLAPYGLFRRGVQSILENDGAYAFYLHPGEVDPSQPRVKSASVNYRFRHYANLAKTERRLRRLIENFRQCRFMTCNEYLRNVVPVQ